MQIINRTQISEADVARETGFDLLLVANQQMLCWNISPYNNKTM